MTVAAFTEVCCDDFPKNIFRNNVFITSRARAKGFPAINLEGTLN